MQHKMIV